MFDQFNNTQNLADLMKAFIFDHTKGADERKALRALQEFEGLMWHKVAFEHALTFIEPARFEIDAAGNFTFTPGEPHTKPIEALIYVMYKFKELSTGRPTLFGTEEAAAYLGITLRTLKWYLYEVEDSPLKPSLPGKKLIFTVQDLYDFERARKPDYRPGRPKTQRTLIQ
jgi:hypothetical protein